MKHSPLYIKWFCRCLLVLLGSLMTYVVIQPSYNFSHLIPHSLFKQLHIPYKVVLLGEQHADKLLHFFGAIALMFLLTKAKIWFINKRWAFILTCLLCLVAELTQFFIERGFNSSDLLLGFLGSFMAYLGINENNCRLTE